MFRIKRFAQVMLLIFSVNFVGGIASVALAQTEACTPTSNKACVPEPKGTVFEGDKGTLLSGTFNYIFGITGIILCVWALWGASKALGEKQYLDAIVKSGSAFLAGIGLVVVSTLLK